MRRSILGVLLGLVLSAGGVLIAAHSVKSPPRIVEIWPIGAGIVVTFMVWLVQGTVLAVLSRHDIEARPELKRRLWGLPVLKTVRVYLVTQAVGAITPFAGAEVAAQIMELKRLGLPADKGSAVATVKAIANVTSLFIGAVVGLFVVSQVPFVGQIRNKAQNPGISWTLVVVFVAIVVLLTLGIFVVRRWRKRKQEGAEKTEVDSKPGWKERLANFFREYRDDLRLLWRNDPRAVLASFGLMAVFWLLYPLLGVFGLMAAGWSGQHWFAVYTAQYILFMVIPFAPTPGNSGAAEIAFVALMSAYVGHGALLGGVLIWRFLNHYSELVTGALLAGRSVWDDVAIVKQELGSDHQSG